VDPNIARKTVRCLGPVRGRPILEIGPGRGALTSVLMEYGAELFLLEKDEQWARHVRFSPARPAVAVADALRFDWKRADGKMHGIIGNLPYNIASPLLWEMVRDVARVPAMVFTLQKEVALRIAAEPGGRTYGALSVWIQSFSRVRLEFTVPPHLFKPRPKVHSAVVSLSPRPQGDRPCDPEGLASVLRRCFQKRRKQLRTILRPVWCNELSRWMAEEEIRPECRPEALSPEQFRSLANRLKSRTN
jgi:16S rRNA (adenine1518-N6/adenine1519-N6)-dimethyltransferase